MIPKLVSLISGVLEKEFGMFALLMHPNYKDKDFAREFMEYIKLELRNVPNYIITVKNVVVK